jgi:hypothetical protein
MRQVACRAMVNVGRNHKCVRLSRLGAGEYGISDLRSSRVSAQAGKLALAWVFEVNRPPLRVCWPSVPRGPRSATLMSTAIEEPG